MLGVNVNQVRFQAFYQYKGKKKTYTKPCKNVSNQSETKVKMRNEHCSANLSFDLIPTI